MSYPPTEGEDVTLPEDDEVHYTPISLIDNNLDRAVTFKKKVVGIVCVVLLVANSVGQSEYSSFVFSDYSFEGYYFLAWFSYIWLICCFPIYIFGEFVWKFFTAKMYPREYFKYMLAKLRENPDFSLRNYMNSATVLAMFNFTGLYLFYLSLSFIPVAIMTSVYQAVIIIVFLLSVFVLGEKVYFPKVVAVLLCITGVAMISVNQMQESDSSLVKSKVMWGVIVTLLQSVCDAVFEVTYRRKLGDTNIHAGLLINSIFGFYGISFGIILLPLWHFQVEPMVSLQETRNVIFILTNASFTVMYLLVFAFGLSVSSPLYINLSTLLALPIAGIIDLLLKKVNLSWLGGIGIAAIFSGILIINIHNWWIHDKEKEREIRSAGNFMRNYADENNASDLSGNYQSSSY